MKDNKKTAAIIFIIAMVISSFCDIITLKDIFAYLFLISSGCLITMIIGDCIVITKEV